MIHVPPASSVSDEGASGHTVEGSADHHTDSSMFHASRERRTDQHHGGYTIVRCQVNCRTLQPPTQSGNKMKRGKSEEQHWIWQQQQRAGAIIRVTANEERRTGGRDETRENYIFSMGTFTLSLWKLQRTGDVILGKLQNLLRALRTRVLGHRCQSLD